MNSCKWLSKMFDFYYVLIFIFYVFVHHSKLCILPVVVDKCQWFYCVCLIETTVNGSFAGKVAPNLCQAAILRQLMCSCIKHLTHIFNQGKSCRCGSEFIQRYDVGKQSSACRARPQQLQLNDQWPAAAPVNITWMCAYWQIEIHVMRVCMVLCVVRP